MIIFRQLRISYASYSFSFYITRRLDVKRPTSVLPRTETRLDYVTDCHQKIATSSRFCSSLAEAESSQGLIKKGEDGEEDVVTYKEFLTMIPREKEYVEEIIKCLECTQTDAEGILKTNFYFGMVPLDAFSERVNAFKKLGVTSKDLQSTPSVIFINFDQSYHLLCRLCQTHKCDGHSVFPFLLLPAKKVDVYLKSVPLEAKVFSPFANRIKYLSIMLRISERVVSEEMLRYPHLRNLPPHRIVGMMELLLDAGVDRRHIYNDLWVFKYNLQAAQKRLREAQNVGMKDIKPWHIRCTEAVFCRSIKQYLALNVYPEGSSWEDNVAEMLNCSVEEVRTMVRSDERISKVRLPRMHKKYRILKAAGFSVQEIMQNPRIFLQISSNTLKRRLDIIEEHGLKLKDIPYCLGTLTRREQIFRSIVELAVKNTEQSQEK